LETDILWNACDDLEINLEGNDLSISNLPSLNVVIDLFDNRFAIISRCVGDCGSSQMIENLAEGDYLLRVKIYDSKWDFVCEIEESINVTGTGIIEIADDRDNLTIAPNSFGLQTQSLPAVTLFPNPATNEVNLGIEDLIGTEIEINIINTYGQSVYQYRLEEVQHPQFTINSSNFSNGFYFVRIQADDQRIINKKMLIKRNY